ncbi:hypothetical protein EON64_20475, partial [archaeon]
MINSVDDRGGKTRRWRLEKEIIAAVRTQGKTQSKVLSNIVQRTDQMIKAELCHQEEQSRRIKVQQQRSESLIQKKVDTAPSPYRLIKTPISVPTFDVNFDTATSHGHFDSSYRPFTSSATTGRASRLQSRARALSPNLPLPYLSRRQDLVEDSDVLSEQSRALREYESLAHGSPRVKFHLPFTDSFAEAEGQDIELSHHFDHDGSYCALDRSNSSRMTTQLDLLESAQPPRKDSSANSLSLRIPSTQPISYDA